MSMPAIRKESYGLQRALATAYAEQYCARNGLSLEKLKGQRFDIVMNRAIFSQPSGVRAMGLTNDRETLPKPTLVITFDSKGLSIAETEHTKEYLRR